MPLVERASALRTPLGSWDRPWMYLAGELYRPLALLVFAVVVRRESDGPDDLGFSASLFGGVLSRAVHLHGSWYLCWLS